MSFVLSKAVDPNKVFIIRKSDVTSRWDAPYFIPSIVELEKQVQKITKQRLWDYAQRIAGGATPPTSESETHYTESESGIPFIRVQNLSTTGKLNLEDCKRITRNTHETLLERSRLGGGELLVKITGVGRMAVASIVPEGFEANINQHIAAIWTENPRASETLAAYLNLDFVERLATRRSTGGTRPALDYPALLSIPVIFDERIPKLVNEAVESFANKIQQAKLMLSGIDSVLIEELKIKALPEPPNTIECRIFRKKFSSLTGYRWDAHFYQPRFDGLIKNLNSLPSQTLRSASETIFSGITPLSGGDAYSEKELGVAFVRSGDFNENGTINEKDLIYIKREVHSGLMRRSQLKPNDVLFAIVGATIGKVGIFNGGYEANINQAVCAVRFENGLLPQFVHAFFMGRLGKAQIDRVKRPVARANLNIEEVGTLRIPKVDQKIQMRIISRVGEIQNGSLQLRREAAAELNAAKKSIEAMILGTKGVK